MERNMEAGMLITGDHLPRLLEDHLQSLIEANVSHLSNPFAQTVLGIDRFRMYR